MAYLTQVYTATTANTNLTTATLVGTYTNTTRIRKLWVNIFLDQVKGNGDYIANIRVQRAGAGSEYVSIKTTLALAAGVTAGYFGSIPITLNATDVMKVYLLGLATDNDGTADVIVDVNEEWLNVDASGRVDLGSWLGVAPAALSTNGYIQAMMLRWLTDNAAGTPDALSSNKLPADVKLWLAAAPAALSTNGYLQVMLMRWLTDNAAGTPLALAAQLVQATFIASGGGSVAKNVYIKHGGVPIDGVDVWVTTDLAGTNVIARGYTNALGLIVFYLDPGTYYAWKALAGYTFTNPESFTVP